LGIDIIIMKEEIKKKWNESAPTFDQRPGHGIHSEHEKLAWKSILKNLVGEKPRRVLDVGTGTGFIALLIGEMGHHVTGIDIAEDMLEQAKVKATKGNMDIEFQLGDADELPFDNNVFDVVINRHVLWTMPKPKKAVAEWARVLKPGGKLVIIDGDWTHYSAKKSLWKIASNLAILITEGRNPYSKSQGLRNFERDLPMRKVKRPEADIAILEGLGLKTSFESFKDPRSYGFLDNIKYGYYDLFVITAIK